MMSSRELEVRHYWRTLRDLKRQREDGATAPELADTLDEIDTLAAATSSPYLRTLCLTVIATVAGATASSATALAHGETLAGSVCCTFQAAARLFGLA